MRNGIDVEAHLAACPPFPIPEVVSVGRLVTRLRQTFPDFDTLMIRYAEPGSALRHFGLILWNGGDHEGAVQVFTAALCLSSNDPALWRDLAHVFQGMGRQETARTCTLRSLRIDPRSALSWLLLGNLAWASGSEDAEPAFRMAIDLQADLTDAHFALGMLLMAGKREVEAIRCFQATLALMPGNAGAALCLGQACYLVADYPGALAAFARADELGPVPDAARRNLNRARAFCAMLDGDVDKALAEGRTAGEEPDALLYEAFSLFSAHGHVDAAIRIGHIRLAQKPDDPVRIYLLDALQGRAHLSAPVDYLETYFDAFAPTFEEKLVKVLDYRVPERLAALATIHLDGLATVIDLGCGTGLAARWLKPAAAQLIGVDVASGMLEQAAQDALYDHLIKAEAVQYLTEHPSCCDLVFAADMLVYLGSLDPLFDAAWRSLRPRGLFCFSIESGLDQDYTLLPSGRFAHGRNYIRALARARFEVLEDEPHAIRLEARVPVDGRLFVLRKAS